MGVMNDKDYGKTPFRELGRPGPSVTVAINSPCHAFGRQRGIRVVEPQAQRYIPLVSMSWDVSAVEAI